MKRVLAILLLTLVLVPVVQADPSPCRDHHLCPPPIVTMGRTLIAGFETLDDTVESQGGTLVSGTSYDATIFRSGARSLKVVVPSGGSAGLGVTNITHNYLRVYVRVTVLPPTAARGILGSQSAGMHVLINTNGTLVVKNNSGATVGTSTTALTDSTRWYRIELRGLTGSSVPVLLIDGNTEVTGSPGVSDGMVALVGSNESGSGAYTVYYDDLVADDTAFPGDSSVALLLPVSDNSRGSWIAGGGGTTNLWDAIDNRPPAGKISPQTNTSAITNSVSGATTPNGDFNMTTYTAAGVSGTVVAVVMLISHGEDVSTGTKTGTFKIVSNPDSGTADNVAAGGSNQFGPSAGGAVGAYPTNWLSQASHYVQAPTVVLSTAPVARITKTDTGTRAADLCFMGIYVEWQPFIPPLPTILQAVNRAASY